MSAKLLGQLEGWEGYLQHKIFGTKFASEMWYVLHYAYLVNTWYCINTTRGTTVYRQGKGFGKSST